MTTPSTDINGMIAGSNYFEPKPPRFSDEDLALRFSANHANDLRYCDAWEKWAVWDGARWRIDDTQVAFDLARRWCRTASDEAQTAFNDPATGTRIAAKVASLAKVKAVLTLATSDRRHALNAAAFDRDTWTLNTPAGLVDLQTGQVRAHDPNALCTKIAGASPKGECPLWRRCLNDWTAGDTALQAYLQRVAGYMLTGDVSEQVVFFAYGEGGNGKGAYINTLLKMLGDYGRTAPLDLFTASKNDRHSEELTVMFGARVIAVTETEAHREWSEAKLKTTTGGDRIRARYMRRNGFEFDPTHKPFISGNHKPDIANLDDALKRRFHMIPFMVKIANRDKSIPDKLLAELDGIMAWAVQGCLEWQRVGLNPPPAVMAATEEYFNQQDAVAQWLTENVRPCPDGFVEGQTLFADWKQWALARGEQPRNLNRFLSPRLSKQFAKDNHPVNRRAGFKGIALVSGITTDAPKSEGINLNSEAFADIGYRTVH